MADSVRSFSNTFSDIEHMSVCVTVLLYISPGWAGYSRLVPASKPMVIKQKLKERIVLPQKMLLHFLFPY